MSGSCKIYAEKNMNSEMVTETPTKALLRFSLPLLAGSIFQNLYNVFDTMIVGRMLGKEALSAVGNSYVPMLIVNSVLLGVSSGISILVSQSYGAQKQSGTQECIGSVHAITAIVGTGLPILALISGHWFFGAMNIPGDILENAMDYWKIIAAGFPFSAIYNFYSAIIRAKGNSRLPVKIMGISCVTNVFLDLLFVGMFGLGIRGAAAATVISQAIAAGMAVICLYCFDKAFFIVHPNLQRLLPILKLSVTGIIQNSASAVSMFFIQGLINQYGVNAILAYTSAYKVESILTIPAVNLGTALCVFVGQNIGAKQIERTREGLKASFKIALFLCIIAISVIWLFAPTFMFLLVGNEKAIIEIGVKYLRIVSVTFPFCVSLYLLTNFLRGAGEVAYPLFNTILELSIRTILAFVLAEYIGFVGILLCRPISFIISTVSLSCRCLSKKWQRQRNQSSQSTVK